MRSAMFMLAAGLLFGCANTDAPPPFFDMDYQIRCRGECNNSFDNDVRKISHLDEEEGFRVQCNVEGSGSERSLFASFTCADGEACGGDYAFELANVRLSGSDPGAGCRVFATEGSNTYEGECTATDPTADKPCQVIVEETSGDIFGTVVCVNIPNAANPGQTRGLFYPGTEDATEFSILNCSGL